MIGEEGKNDNTCCTGPVSFKSQEGKLLMINFFPINLGTNIYKSRTLSASG